MTTQEVADMLVTLCSKGQFEEAAKSLYSPDIVSIEASAPPGGSREAKGMAAVQAKGEWWVANHEIHSLSVGGPLVAGAHFAVTYKMDITFKPEAKHDDGGGGRLSSRRRQGGARTVLLRRVSVGGEFAA